MTSRRLQKGTQCSHNDVFQGGFDCTHYGDPKTGCESDEQAVQVMGLSGDFCSPKCDTSGSCPSDLPSGDSATPTCALQTPFGAKYCALVCTPSDSLKNGANGECGTGTCQSVQGTQAVAVATILAPTQQSPRARPGREWRAKRATPCRGEAVAIFAWGRELLLRRPPGYTGGRFN